MFLKFYFLGVIVVFSLDDKSISTYTINGRFLLKKKISKIITDIQITLDSQYLFISVDTFVIIMRLFDLKEIKTINLIDKNLSIDKFYASINSMTLNEEKKQVYIGLKDCSLIIVEYTLN